MERDRDSDSDSSSSDSDSSDDEKKGDRKKMKHMIMDAMHRDGNPIENWMDLLEDMVDREVYKRVNRRMRDMMEDDESRNAG